MAIAVENFILDEEKEIVRTTDSKMYSLSTSKDSYAPVKT